MDQQEKPTKFLYLPQAKNDHFIIGGRMTARCVRTGIGAGAGT